MRTRKQTGGKYQDDFEKACRLGQLEKVQALITKKVVNPAANNQLSLQFAIETQRTEIVQFLFTDPRINPALHNQTLFNLACKKGINDSIVRLFLADPRIDPMRDEQIGLHYAIMNGKTPIVKLFLSDPRIDPALQDQRAFRIAVQYDKVNIIKLFLSDPRIDPALEDQRAFLLAIHSNKLDSVKLLLADPRIHPALEDQRAFLLASEYNKPDIVKLLLADPRINPALQDQRAFQLAIKYNNLDIVKLFLADPRIDPALQHQRGLNIACGWAAPALVKLFLTNPRIDPSLNEQYCLKTAIEKEKAENVEVLLEDPRINPSINNQVFLKQACLVGNADIVKILLRDPRVDPSVDDQEPLRIATDNNHSAVVDVLKVDPRVQGFFLTKWKGLTKSDIKKFDSVFEETANNYSCCPVCLRYVSREDGCMYMNHNCKNEPGPNTIHTKLYTMYKSEEGKIYWCTICGRICLGHRHYTLGSADTKAELVPVKPGANPFATDCSLTEGGGGIQEKAQRFHAFRQYARMLQEEVGEIYHRDAIRQLVESMWVAPLFPATRKLAAKNMQAKKYAIANNEFPVTPQVEVANIPRPAQDVELLPKIIESGYNAISTLDDEKVIQFQHRRRDGTINRHTGEGEQIGVESFANYIQSNLSDGVAGKCWLPSCTAEIHPDESMELVRLGLFPANLQKRYKEAFNHTHQAGGGRANILREAKYAECVMFGKKRSTRKVRK